MTVGTEAPVEQARHLLQALRTALDAGDWEAIRTLCAPDLLFVADATLRGVDDFIAYLSDMQRYFPGIRVEAHETAATADYVVCENHYIAPVGAGWQINGRGCQIYVIRNGRVAEIRDFYVPADDDRIGDGGVSVPGLPPGLAPQDHPAFAFKWAQEQAALRRVSSLVGGGAEPAEVFAEVAREIGQLLDADATWLFQLGDDERIRLVTEWNSDDAVARPDDGSLDAPLLQMSRNGNPLRIETLPAESPVVTAFRAAGIKSVISAPMVVDEAVWGVILAVSRTPHAFPPGTEEEAMGFTMLAGIAVAHASARSNLARSRVRVLAAADASRRQVQRDLHDGAQQRLVHAILQLTVALDLASSHACAAADHAAEALRQANYAKAELRDLVREILPPALTRHGLKAAIESLVMDLHLEVTIQIDEGRLPAAAEITAYFAIVEALTNVVRHARTDHAAVTVVVRDGELVLHVRDDGVGGASDHTGTGLKGLADRIEANGGKLLIDSHVGRGTTVRARIPL